jgi:hypothetical protein
MGKLKAIHTGSIKNAKRCHFGQHVVLGLRVYQNQVNLILKVPLQAMYPSFFFDDTFKECLLFAKERNDSS